MQQESGFRHVYKIIYIRSKEGQLVGVQGKFQVMAGSRTEALALFDNYKESGHIYHIQYWES